MSIACDNTMQNSPCVNCANHCKDCHMIFASGDNEDCHYCINTERSKTSMDMSIAHECTLCYQVVSCRTCYNVDFSAYCFNWRIRLEDRAERFIFPWKLQSRTTEDTQKNILSPIPQNYRIREKEIA